MLDWLTRDWATVLAYAMLTALATGLGAVPFLFVKRISDRLVGHGDAIAAGLMLAASFNLLFEGAEIGLWRTLLGTLAGVAAILVSRMLLKEREVHPEEMARADALKALLIVGVMTAHSFAEGVGVGVSFGQSPEFGLFIALAIAVHNIPEGLAISLVLVPRGVSIAKAAWWSIFSSLPQPLVAVPAFLFVEAFRPFLPVGLGFAAGAMIWMVYSELMPESAEKVSPRKAATTFAVAIVAMMAFQKLLAA